MTNVNANSILPVLEMAQQYFDKKAKRKIFSDFTVDLKNRFNDISNPIDLETQSQKMITDIYSNQYLDPQEQATLLQIGNSFRKLQEDKIKKQQSEYAAMSSVELLNDITKDNLFSVGGKLLKGKELYENIDKKYYNLTPEQKLEMYTKALELGQSKPVESFRADESGFYGMNYIQDKFNNSYQMGEEYKIDKNSKNLSFEARSAYDQYLSGEYQEKQKAIESDRRARINYEYQINKANEMEDLRVDRDIKKKYSLDKSGTKVEIVNPNDPTSTIFATRKLVEPKELTSEENLKNYMMGNKKFGIYDDNNKLIEDAQIKTDLNRLPEPEKERILVPIGNNFATWKEDAYHSVFKNSKLWNLMEKQFSEMLNILLSPNAKDINGATISTGQTLYRQGMISQKIINDIVKLFNTIPINERDEEDIQLINSIEYAFGNKLYDRGNEQKSQTLKEELRNRINSMRSERE